MKNGVAIALLLHDVGKVIYRSGEKANHSFLAKNTTVKMFIRVYSPKPLLITAEDCFNK